MNNEEISQAFCSSCGRLKPENIETAYCVPCANAGHMYRLITNETERKSSLRNWMLFWEDKGFAAKEIEAIPTYRNLTRYSFA